jgi:hypothetical protein
MIGNRRRVEVMPKSEPVNFLSRLIESVLRTLSGGPPSIEAEGLAQVADSLRDTIKAWRRSPPTPAEREEVVKRVLSLHAEVNRSPRAARERLAIRKPDPREEPDSERPKNKGNDRPTVPPPFDMQAYARDMSAPDWEGDRSSMPATPRYPATLSALDESMDMDISWSISMETAPPNGVTLEAADAPAPRSLSPSSIEHALLGFVDDPGAPVVTERDLGDPTAYMLDRFSIGDYADALDVAELILIEDPANRLAGGCRDDCRAALERDSLRDLGPINGVPAAVARATAVEHIDHRAGFLLSLVDGKSSLEEVVEACGMPRLDALRILQELVRRGVVRIG